MLILKKLFATALVTMVLVLINKKGFVRVLFCDLFLR